MENIAVFFGGSSTEREISTITGVLILNALKVNYNPIPVFIDKDNKAYSGENMFSTANFNGLPENSYEVAFLFGDNCLYKKKKGKIKRLIKIDCAINCMHGVCGEDGSVCGITAFSNIPIASPDIASSAISMDKVLTKYFLRGIKVKTLPFIRVKDKTDLEKGAVKKIKYPVIVKPSCGGSSIGITVANNYDELVKGVEYADSFGNDSIIEPCLKDFTEINCSAYSGKKGIVVSELEEPVRRTDFLTFTDKYKSGKRIFPAKIDVDLEREIKETTKRVYSLLNFSGIIRIDYMISGDTVYLNEINSVPGSLAYYFYSDRIKDFSPVLTEIISRAIEDGKKREKERGNFTSDILSNINKGGKGCKRL